jgi:hypothetical protein
MAKIIFSKWTVVLGLLLLLMACNRERDNPLDPGGVKNPTGQTDPEPIDPTEPVNPIDPINPIDPSSGSSVVLSPTLIVGDNESVYGSAVDMDAWAVYTMGERPAFIANLDWGLRDLDGSGNLVLSSPHLFTANNWGTNYTFFWPVAGFDFNSVTRMEHIEGIVNEMGSNNIPGQQELIIQDGMVALAMSNTGKFFLMHVQILNFNEIQVRTYFPK